MLKKIKSNLKNPKKEFQSLTLLETFIITICLFVIIFAVIVGLLDQIKVNNDKIRIRNMVSVTKALASFYNDSSSIEFTRRFPISECSTSSPNSVDYEKTLNLTLTGQTIGQASNGFRYIESNSYPQDLKAEFINSSPIACGDPKTTNSNNACNHRPESGKNFCYLYSTSPNGDRYNLSFYSESKNRLVTLTQLRNDKLQVDNIDLIKELVY